MAPANDLFANAQLITAAGTYAGDTTDASVEAGEPSLWTSGDHSVWYRFEPTVNQYATFDFGATVPLLPANAWLNYVLYAGTALDALTYRDSGQVRSDLHYQTVVLLSSGQTYYLQIFTGYNQAAFGGGPPYLHSAYSFDYSFEVAPVVANDLFENAKVITGSTGTTTDVLYGAAPDPNFGSYYGDVWYRWTPPFSGTATFDTRDTQSENNSWFDVYTGTYPDLTQVGSGEFYWQNDEWGVAVQLFEASAGETYWINANVGGAEMDNHAQTIRLNWHLVPLATSPPSNDAWANAILITGDTGSLSGTIRGATTETDEDWYGGGNTVWYKIQLDEANIHGTTYRWWVEGLPGAVLALWEYDNSWPHVDGLSNWWRQYESHPPDYIEPEIIENIYYWVNENGYGNEGTWYLSVDSWDTGWVGDFTLHWETPPPPTITKIEPTTGSIGTTVHVYGSNFSGSGWRNVYVGPPSFETRGLNMTLIDDGHLTFDTQLWHNHPGNPHGPFGTVKVYTDYGNAESSQTFSSPDPIAPSIDSFTPTTAYWNETTVAITGTHLHGVTKVVLDETEIDIGYVSSQEGNNNDTLLYFVPPTWTPKAPIQLRHHTARATNPLVLDVYQYTHEPSLTLRHVLTDSDTYTRVTPGQGEGGMDIRFPVTSASGFIAPPYGWYRLEGNFNGAAVVQPAYDTTTDQWFNDYNSQLSGYYQTYGPPGQGEVKTLTRQANGDWAYAHRGFITFNGQNYPDVTFGWQPYCVLAGGKVLSWFIDNHAVTRAYGGFFQGLSRTLPPVTLTLAQVNEGDLTVTSLGQYVSEQDYTGYWENAYDILNHPENLTPLFNEVSREQDVVIPIYATTIAAFPGTGYAVLTYPTLLIGAPRAEVIDCTGNSISRSIGGAVQPYGHARNLIPDPNWGWAVVANPDYVPPFDLVHFDSGYIDPTVVLSRGIDSTRAILLAERDLSVDPFQTLTAIVLTRDGTSLSAGEEVRVLDMPRVSELSFGQHPGMGDMRNRFRLDLVKLGDGRFLLVYCGYIDHGFSEQVFYSSWVTFFKVLTISGDSISVGPLSGPWAKTPLYMPGSIYPYGGGDFFLVDTYPPFQNTFVNQYDHRMWQFGATQRVQGWRAEADGTVHPLTNVKAWPTNLKDWGLTDDGFTRYSVGGHFIQDNHPERNTLPAPVLYTEYPAYLYYYIGVNNGVPFGPGWASVTNGELRSAPTVLALVDLARIVPPVPEPPVDEPPTLLPLTIGGSRQGLNVRRLR